MSKRAFNTVVPGHHYQVPEYRIETGKGIVETGEVYDLRIVRGSSIKDQNKFEPVPGTLHEHILTVMIEDLKLKNSELPSRETALAITSLESARHWMEEREEIRAAAGVLGTYLPHKS